MFFEDVNTLYEKYKYCIFWYELSYDDIVDNVDCMVDFIEITKPNTYKAYLKNNFCRGYGYVDESSSPTKHSDGEQITVIFRSKIIPPFEYHLSPNQSLFFPIYVDNEFTGRFTSLRFAPISSMNIIRCGGESNTIKVYLKELLGLEISTVNVGTGKYVGYIWDTDLTTVNVLEDSEGKYVELTANRDGDEFTIISDDVSYFCGKIVNYKALPTITFNTLYRGNTQTIEVYFDGELIDSKYYDLLYQNQVLTNGKITIGEDVTDLELEIYLKHPEYISTKLKYNLPVGYYDCNSQEDIEAGIELGLTTMHILHNTRLIDMALDNISFKGQSNTLLYFENCRVNNCNLKNIRVENINSHFSNTYFDDTKIAGRKDIDRYVEYPSRMYFNNCNIQNSKIEGGFLVCSDNCEFKNNRIDDFTLIFSDDMITFTQNLFYSMQRWTKLYTNIYPLMLYLTGDFKCIDNTFEIWNMYDEFTFSTAVLKTIPETDIDEFIRLNNFNITMNVDNTAYNGLFYCLIDESKLKYKEL